MICWALLCLRRHLPRRQADTPLKIVAFGNSLTAGYGLPAKDAFPAKLERALKAKGVKVEIENAGVSGDTSSGGLSRLDWSIPDGTDGVILELGANDMLRGVDPAVTKKSLDAILAKLKERNIAVLLCGMRAAPNLGANFVDAFDSALRGTREEIRHRVLSVLPRRHRGAGEIRVARRRASERRGRRRDRGEHPAEGGGT